MRAAASAAPAPQSGAVRRRAAALGALPASSARVSTCAVGAACRAAHAPRGRRGAATPPRPAPAPQRRRCRGKSGASRRCGGARALFGGAALPPRLVAAARVDGVRRWRAAAPAGAPLLGLRAVCAALVPAVARPRCASPPRWPRPPVGGSPPAPLVPASRRALGLRRLPSGRRRPLGRPRRAILARCGALVGGRLPAGGHWPPPVGGGAGSLRAPRQSFARVHVRARFLHRASAAPPWPRSVSHAPMPPVRRHSP